MMPRARVEPTGITLEYATYGRHGDPAVLLLMGLSGPHLLWPPGLVDGLVEHGYHVIAFDHRDVGGSTTVDDPTVGRATLCEAFAGWTFTPPYRLEDLARDAMGLLDHLDVSRAHLIGTSMGGMIAQHLALRDPARVTSLTSINSTTGLAVPREPLPRPVPVPDPRPPAVWEEFRPWLVDGLRELSSPRWFDELETARLARAVWEQGVHPAGSLHQLLAVLADGDRTARLRRITTPTLVLHGADDPLIDVAGGRATAAAVPEARLVVLRDMAHDLPLPLIPRLLEELTAHLDTAAAPRPATPHGRATRTSRSNVDAAPRASRSSSSEAKVLPGTRRAVTGRANDPPS